MDLLPAFQQFVKEHALFESTDRLLLAVSGGVDSIVLLDLLLLAGFRPALAHVNFQLRGEESDQDAAFVKELAELHTLPHFECRRDTADYAAKNSLSVQMAARELRYVFFEELRQKNNYQYIITAHHIDDSLETFLINFLRGTGVAGLTGVPVKSGDIRRPLLFANRQQILAYQQLRTLRYREDSSNAKPDYQRNALRLHVLPHLYNLQPGLAEVAKHNFTILNGVQSLLEDHIELLEKQMWDKSSDPWRLDRNQLEAHPQAFTLLWHWLRPLGFSREQQRQIYYSHRLRSSSSTHIIQTEPTTILLYKKTSQQAEVVWEANDKEIKFGNWELSKQALDEWSQFPTSSEVAWIDSDKLSFPISIRYWQAGDYFCPIGMSGKRQKLQDFFVNKKINQVERHRVPLLINGDGRIIWVVSHRLDDRFKITNKTTKAVAFSLLPKSDM